MKNDGAGDESSALRRHQAVGAYHRWNPPSFDAPPPPAPEPVSPKDDAAQAEARERRRMQKAAAEMRRRQKEEAEKARAETEEAQRRAVEAAIAEQKRLLEEQMLAQQRQWPTAEEIEQVHENAHKEGFEAGRAEGYAEGHAHGLREGFASGEAQARGQLNAQADALTQIIASLDVALAEIDQQVADELIALAVELARKMCQHSISRPENVRALVQDALQQVPQKHVQIHLHPQDAAHVRARLLEGLDETQQRIVEDDTLTPGGCILLGDGNHLDASVQTRWRRILGEVGFSGHEALWELGEEELVSEDEADADAEAAPAPPDAVIPEAETVVPEAAADAPAPAEAAAAEMPAPEATAQPTTEPAPAAGASVGAPTPAAEPPQGGRGPLGGQRMTDAHGAAGVSVGAHHAPQ